MFHVKHFLKILFRIFYRCKNFADSFFRFFIIFYAADEFFCLCNGLAQKLGLTYNAANRLAQKLLAAGIVTQTSPTKRGRTFSYRAYLDILRRGTELY